MALDAPRNNSTYARIPAAMVANKHLIAVHELLKKECEDLIGLCDKVKLWVNLTMPKIEDGDNFGSPRSLAGRLIVLNNVQVSRFKKAWFPTGALLTTKYSIEALSELHRSQESAYALRDAGRQHHLNRAKICSKIMKYPFLEDYTIALREHDERQLYLATQNLSDLRNVYAVLTDILHKNIAKIRAPKANNGLSLY
ncbi:proteasome activator pa28, REG alpha/beta subunit [Rickenella mellea]|uniref:Proteasome activator pa28, REG alpha/beta subunit n=1 Tax=Rickenella mellea TaxID=50990 RepID=A0A4Y7QKQ5_9AGAM|nr:proteasome activator pa28, REG alpha/beta subunit [Rickenella mellea]